MQLVLVAAMLLLILLPTARRMGASALATGGDKFKEENK
jgi:hypothetical protein